MIIQRICKAVSVHHQLEVSLKNFGHFGFHTIYISVDTPTPIVKLVQSLYSELYFLKSRGFFARKPHMTIAKGLDEDKFYSAMADFHRREYVATFIADRIVLMKRKGKFSRYEIVKEFELGIKIAQGF
jgi:2'-5' RNA ligase